MVLPVYPPQKNEEKDTLAIQCIDRCGVERLGVLPECNIYIPEKRHSAGDVDISVRGKPEAETILYYHIFTRGYAVRQSIIILVY